MAALKLPKVEFGNISFLNNQKKPTSPVETRNGDFKFLPTT